MGKTNQARKSHALPKSTEKLFLKLEDRIFISLDDRFPHTLKVLRIVNNPKLTNGRKLLGNIPAAIIKNKNKL